MRISENLIFKKILLIVEKLSKLEKSVICDLDLVTF